MTSFEQQCRELPVLLRRLLDCPPSLPGQLPRDLPSRGVYLFSEETRHLYVGRARDLRQRVQRHCRNSSGPGVASFAMLLARESTARRATYRRGESRSALLAEASFADAFRGAKERIRSMSVRFVGVNDANTEALLEIYAAQELPTPYNDFETH